MKKGIICIMALLLMTALPLVAQEKEQMADSHAQMGPPKALDNEWCHWLVGEWKGSSEGPMGKSEGWEKMELGLDGQFLFREAKSTMADGSEYTGMGAITVDPHTGAFAGYWIDSMRGMYKGSGSAEGGKLTLTWKGYQGTYTQVIEKAGKDKMTGTWKFADAEGNAAEGTFEMSRVKDGTNGESN